MDRWTMEDLERTDDIDFAIAILNERRAKLTPYSPLGTKLTETVHTLNTIKEERDKYIAKVAEATAQAQITMEEAASFDAPEEGPCDPCQPTFPECEGCDYAGEEPQETEDEE